MYEKIENSAKIDYATLNGEIVLMKHDRNEELDLLIWVEDSD